MPCPFLISIWFPSSFLASAGSGGAFGGAGENQTKTKAGQGNYQNWFFNQVLLSDPINGQTYQSAKPPFFGRASSFEEAAVELGWLGKETERGDLENPQNNLCGDPSTKNFRTPPFCRSIGLNGNFCLLLGVSLARAPAQNGNFEHRTKIGPKT